MKVRKANNGDGTLTFSIPDHPDAPTTTFKIADYTTGKRLRDAAMEWAREYGVSKAENF